MIVIELTITNFYCYILFYWNYYYGLFQGFLIFIIITIIMHMIERLLLLLYYYYSIYSLSNKIIYYIKL